MRTYDAGHIESQTTWPDPLENTGFWRVGTLALPVAMLSSCSATVLLLVYGFLQLFGREQELFVLPWPGTFAVGIVAAGIAWLIVYRCRKRPGRPWPRFWALALATLNTTVALLGLALPDQSSILTLAVAGLSAAIALLPRLIKVPPDSAMVQRVAPIGVLIALLIVPSSCAVRHAIARKTEQRVDGRILQLQELTAGINDATSYDWLRMEDSPDAAKRKTDKLAALFVPNGRDDASLWHAAVILGKDDELFQAMEEATDAAVAGFEPGRAPRVSTLREAAIRWDPQARRWEPYTQFPALSAITGSYHQELGRIYSQLAPQTLKTESVGLAAYQQHYEAQRATLQSHLNEIAASWSDNWAAYKVPGHDDLIGRVSAPLREVLRAPFAMSADSTLAPAQLWRLASLPLSDVKRLAAGSPGCEAAELGATRDAPRAPGCHCQNFGERNLEYFRLDCYSYSPRIDSTAADLRVEMRLVYQQPSKALWQTWSMPTEVYFQFLLPEGADSDAFREEVMTDLATAARGFLPPAVRILPNDRSGSVANGFTMQGNRAAVRVSRPTVERLIGLVPEKRALVVVVRATNRAV